MILSVSRRTDIPAYYSQWFMNRLQEGYALVRNPRNPRRISRIPISPEVVDGIVFWTKNPIPMLKNLSELDPYLYYFQFTLTPYGKDVEPGLPSKEEKLIPAFQALSAQIGKERVIWRYDPILLSDVYTVEYHCRRFYEMAKKLSGFTRQCTISFLDFYRNIRGSLQTLRISPVNQQQMMEIAKRFSQTAQAFGFTLSACAETTDFLPFGIAPANCVDKDLLERLGGFHLCLSKDPNQRQACGCAASVDIGAYNSCRNGCVYCYANHSRTLVEQNSKQHNPNSPLLYGEIKPGDVITEKKVASSAKLQYSLFET